MIDFLSAVDFYGFRNGFRCSMDSMVAVGCLIDLVIAVDYLIDLVIAASCLWILLMLSGFNNCC